MPVCDNVDEVWVALISFEGNKTKECADLAVKGDGGQSLGIEEMCPCFLNANQEYLYGVNCRPNDVSLYSFRDVAYWCYGEEQLLEGPTDTTIGFDKSYSANDLSGWSGVDDSFVRHGQKLRQTFSVNDMDTGDDDSKYMLIEFNSCAHGGWEDGDAITVEIDYTEVYRYEISGDFAPTCDGSNEQSHSFILPLDPYFTATSDSEYEFTLGYTSNLAGLDEYFSVSSTALSSMTRRDVATFCRDVQSYNEAVNHPIFVQETSGFIWNYANSPLDSIRLHLEIEVPRRLFDFTIDFDNGDGLSGFSESRIFAESVSDLTQTYWYSDRLTADTIVSSTADPCGRELWKADIPWDVLNEQGSGGFEQIERFNNGTSLVEAENYYMFATTTLVEAYESVMMEVPDRMFEDVRRSSWRVPFVVRFQRTVFVSTEVSIVLCPEDGSGGARCTITSVAAIVEHTQSNTVYDLSTRTYRADVNLKIDTKVFYPYMFVSCPGIANPPAYFSEYGGPLEGGAWFPPTITYTPADGVSTQVEIQLSFLDEDTAGCTFNPSNDIGVNVGRDCLQHWNMHILPLNGACQIDGTYTVTWAAMCFYDKPTCTFNSDEFGNSINTVSVSFDVHSTNMCPEIAHEVDLYGEMCPTGRYEYQQCPGVSMEDLMTYFQDDETYFFVSVESNSARIIYSRLLEIWVEQDFTNLDPTETPLDMNLNGLIQLWDIDGPNQFNFTSSVTGVTETVPDVMREVQDSNYFATNYGFASNTGTGDSDLGLYTGFKVFLDKRIFPRTLDRWDDATFRVVVEVLYEGWGDSKPRRMLQEQTFSEGIPPFSGRRTIMLSETVRIDGPVSDGVDTPEKEKDWLLDPSSIQAMADSSSISLTFWISFVFTGYLLC
jgi:hypothetical protein